LRGVWHILKRQQHPQRGVAQFLEALFREPLFRDEFLALCDSSALDLFHQGLAKADQDRLDARDARRAEPLKRAGRT